MLSLVKICNLMHGFQIKLLVLVENLEVWKWDRLCRRLCSGIWNWVDRPVIVVWSLVALIKTA